MPPDSIQRLSRLVPLPQIHARLDAIAGPVAAREIALSQAHGCVLGADVVAAAPLPSQALALRDGWALEAHRVGDAGPYSPLPLVPEPVWVEAGDPLPAAADAVLAPDAVVTVTDGAMEAIAAAAIGDHVLPAGADAGATPLCRAGAPLRASDIAAIRAVGLDRVPVRAPRIRVIWTHPHIDGASDVVAALIARAISAEGGEAALAWAPSPTELGEQLQQDGFDAAITIGGTGSGERDRSVKTLADIGHVEIHGMGVRPGETAALATIRSHPVLLLPGRLDAALAIWLVIGRHLLARLTGRAASDPLPTATLVRKVASTIGIADVIPVGACAGGIEPLAAGYFPLQSLTRAAGWIFVPPDSEGFPAGATVELRPLP